MPSKYAPPSVEAIPELSEDESYLSSRADIKLEARQRAHQELLPESANMSGRSSSEKSRDKSRRKARSSTSGGSRHSTRSKEKSSSSRRATPSAVHEERSRHGRTSSRHSISSSSDEEELDHRTVLAAARARLTSPSLLSTLTSLTTATNHSGGSSGSNSTVTQASFSRQSSKDQPELSNLSESPAVPDAPEMFPDVFAFLEQEGAPEDAEQHDLQDEKLSPVTPWLAHHPAMPYHSPIQELLNVPSGDVSSSASSSLHSDDASERAGDHETDRSTSPERSAKDEGEVDVDEGQAEGEGDHVRPDTAKPTDLSAAKIASQMLAAHHRQTVHAAYPYHMQPYMQPQSLGTAVVPRPNDAYTSPHPKHIQTSKIAAAGYDALANKLSSADSRIPPIYRKFSALNHRLLLHLQDELSELEDQLQHLDKADAQSRRISGPQPDESFSLPASRRAAARANGPLEWHKADIMAKIGFKMAQYNQALASFHATQAMQAPEDEAVASYKAYLDEERPIVETESAFLKHHSDLVVVNGTRKSEIVPSPSAHAEIRSFPVAVAVAAAVLIPILTFPVIPGFMGRMTVVLLVALGVVGACIQAGGIAGAFAGERDNLGWGLLYGAVMMVVAGVAG